MGSNIKRNKILVKSLEQYIRNNINIKYYRYNSELVEKYVIFKFSNGIDIKLRIYTYIDLDKIISVEDSKGRINVGFDTSSLRLFYDRSSLIAFFFRITEAVVDFRNLFASGAKGNLDSAMKSFDSGLYYEAYKRLEADGDLEKLVSVHNGHDYDRVVESTKLYKDIYSMFLNAVAEDKVSIKLNDDAFKFIKNRKFIPVFIVDIDNGILEYGYNAYPQSDRKYRVRIDINEYLSELAERGKMIYQYDSKGWEQSVEIPVGLTHISIENSKYFK